MGPAVRAPGEDAEQGPSLVTRSGVTVAIDELEDGTLLAEIDDRTGAGSRAGLARCLSGRHYDEKWTGAELAEYPSGPGICHGPTQAARALNTRLAELRTFSECLLMACRRAHPDIDDRSAVPSRTLTSSRMVRGRRLGVFPLAASRPGYSTLYPR